MAQLFAYLLYIEALHHYCFMIFNLESARMPEKHVFATPE